MVVFSNAACCDATRNAWLSFLQKLFTRERQLLYEARSEASGLRYEAGRQKQQTVINQLRGKLETQRERINELEAQWQEAERRAEIYRVRQNYLCFRCVGLCVRMCAVVQNAMCKTSYVLSEHTEQWSDQVSNLRTTCCRLNSEIVTLKARLAQK